MDLKYCFTATFKPINVYCLSFSISSSMVRVIYSTLDVAACIGTIIDTLN